MIKEVLPEGSLPEEVINYLDRMQDNIAAAIQTAQAVFVSRTVPDRAVSSLLYYLDEPLSDTIPAGFWTWFKDDSIPDKGYWTKLVVSSELNTLRDSMQNTIDELEERILILEDFHGI